MAADTMADTQFINTYRIRIHIHTHINHTIITALTKKMKMPVNRVFGWQVFFSVKEMGVTVIKSFMAVIIIPKAIIMYIMPIITHVEKVKSSDMLKVLI
jgi:hypothetical protein